MSNRACDSFVFPCFPHSFCHYKHHNLYHLLLKICVNMNRSPFSTCAFNIPLKLFTWIDHHNSTRAQVVVNRTNSIQYFPVAILGLNTLVIIWQITGILCFQDIIKMMDPYKCIVVRAVKSLMQGLECL